MSGKKLHMQFPASLIIKCIQSRAPVLTGLPSEWLNTFLWRGERGQPGDWTLRGEAGWEMYLEVRFTLVTEIELVI